MYSTYIFLMGGLWYVFYLIEETFNFTGEKTNKTELSDHCACSTEKRTKIFKALFLVST